MQDKIPGDLIISTSEGAGWDNYVLGHPGSFFYHLYGWSGAFQETFGFKRYYLQAKVGEKVCGILPLILAEAAFSRKLVSIPVGAHASVLADDINIENALILRAQELAGNLKCDYLELRGKKSAGQEFITKDLYVNFIKPLPQNKEECLLRMPRKARASARHAIDSGLTCEIGLTYFDICYEIYARNQKHLGSPVVAKQWFEVLARNFRDKTNILVVKHNGKCIASVLAFFYKDTVIPFYGASLPGYDKYYPNNFMYLKLQEYGVEKNYKYFDFGRSRKGAGSYYFKINQGFEPAQLYYQYFLCAAKKIPDINPSNKKFDLARLAWRRLPLFMTKRLGPIIFKYVMP